MTASIGFHGPPMHIWWRPNQPHEIHMVSDDPMFHDGNNDHIGLWTTYSCNPKSANYHPQNFNRLARALREQGKDAPDEVEEHDRRLNARSRLIALWEKVHPRR